MEKRRGVDSTWCVLNPFSAIGDELSDCGVGGAKELRLLLRMFSMSTLRKGSGSLGSMLSPSSLLGEAGFDGVVKVMCGRGLGVVGVGGSDLLVR
ncbi:hypothetical protein CH063_13641 [Colletotrichum higginsianum]|uniref:Uncharacterized protein n=1 Tax=Colletotrichum higginsianum (strain IMI 349063) TaxID=759273 RepID=H1VV92_COLHI|nr:hypothetical protein CH063_13641 [Colletotrichum higginsianum]